MRTIELDIGYATFVDTTTTTFDTKVTAQCAQATTRLYDMLYMFSFFNNLIMTAFEMSNDILCWCEDMDHPTPARETISIHSS
mmetsp:Transcript_11941/g.22006  ORF Transcript_11941/g.22006 Transcript_11941/m.22006 type:complete len:83 (+) Transcript_11941:1624-1872(+)